MVSDSDIIEYAYKNALRGNALDRETVIALLEIRAESVAAGKLGEAARKVAAEITENSGRVWASIGVDYAPCPVSCHFCSFGEQWGVVREEYRWSTAEIVDLAKKFLYGGAKWITLRTTEYYSLAELTALAKQIRQTIPGNYGIVANTGELTDQTARLLMSSGVSVIYHSLRLREGIDTGLSIKSRLETLAAVQASPLDLAFLVEPVGSEHTSAELADAFLTAMNYDASLTGVMARIPVPGTPLGHIPVVSERRLAQIAAVTRLAAGCNAPDICIHPASLLALEWGANVVVVEVGAIPRDTGNSKKEWNNFDLETAFTWFKQADYKVDRGV
ncbi:radical SAM protein [Sporomusa acidovorans]|uniref:Biotin synthase n=1 Tax=Sporomusa acidovorans (strain ATCC 49682 / DSM 3132 / Mol) TaxID=1123286 RepID=A0ABZ3JAZ2_SPOA4|nr:radical SAM protein [Sporomusa acidovorans]OZC21720.1 biotin synthase [Sporomusa acidovorans DSM 3132]SDD59141.1 biotin synthase [Sporomusa acidovorans]